MPLLEQGQLIRDTYEVERFLGQGAFAEVYRVKHRFLGRQAMKVFKRTGMTLPEIEQMLGEAILLSHLRHPNIVSVFDANVFDTPRGACGYFTMEHIPGGSLDKFWRSFGSSFIPVETTVDLIKQVCRGLGQAHQEKPPIIHRDIKPVRSLVEPLQVAMDNGARKVMIPVENKRNFLEVSGDIMEKVDPIFYSDPQTAVLKALALKQPGS